ncbi:MAG: hypothetical protein IJQ53_00675 [Clostridia bacterium]|nr:hypothetical protein [Clostridia bacterium]
MFIAPFDFFISTNIIVGFLVFRKCAIFLLLPGGAADGRLDLPKHHFGNIARCVSDDRERLGRIEVADCRKALTVKHLCRVIPAAGQDLKRHAVGQHVTELFSQIVLVKLFKEAVGADVPELLQIVGIVVLDDLLGDPDDRLFKGAFVLDLAEAVFKVLDDLISVPILHPPKPHFISVSAVGVGEIEDVAQLVGNIPVNEKGDPFRSLVHPSSEPIPHFDLGTCGRIRLLCEDEDLIRKAVFVVVRRSPQKRHIGLRLLCYLSCRVGGQLQCQTVLTRHFSFLLSAQLDCDLHRTVGCCVEQSRPGIGYGGNEAVEPADRMIDLGL